MSGFEYVGTELDVAALATRWKRYFADLIGPYLHGSILEVGAGMGETTRALWNPRVRRWVCVEPDARLASRIGQLQLPGGARPEVVVGDIHAVPPEQQFDGIVYIDVLEHIAADVDELREAARRLVPSGCLIVLSPAFQVLYSPFDRSIGHERRYTKRTLSAAFPPELEREAVFYADSLAVMLSLTNRLLLRQALPTRRQVLFWDRVIVPLSRVIDPLVGRTFGRSVIAVYRRPLR